MVGREISPLKGLGSAAMTLRAVPWAAWCAALALGAQPAPTLTNQIDEIIRPNGTASAIWGVYVEEVQTGRVLYATNEDVPLLPASNQKLLTVAAALDALGRDYRYVTTLHFAGSVSGSTMRGDLIIRGSGDPSMGSAELAADDPLRRWARSLAGMGIERFEGRFIGDDNVFDDHPYAEGWDVDHITRQSSGRLGVSAGGLSYHDNVARVQVSASSVGRATNVEVSPPGYLVVQNRSTTSGRRRGVALRVDRSIGSEQVTLDGTVPSAYRGTISVPVTNPTTFTLHSFGLHLQRAGIEVEATVIDIDDLPASPDYNGALLLFANVSPPLADVVRVVNKSSNNFYAEQVFRTFGWAGSTGGAERRVKELLSRAGVNPEGVSIRDGSGLSRKNLIPARALVRLLSTMALHPDRDAFFDSIAEGGEAQTTLRGRLQNTRVRAKTGSLEYVRTLSGYATTADGRIVAFAVFANNFTVPPYVVTQAIDRIVASVVSSGAV